MIENKQKRYSLAIATHVSTAVILFASTIGCGSEVERSDAFGNFESSEVLVSAETSGRLVVFRVQEGDMLAAGEEIALVDTVQLALRGDQVRAQREAVRARLKGIAAQLEVLEEQGRVAETERSRVESLLSDGAATEKQMDDVEGQIRVLNRQIDAIRTQNAPIFAEMDVLDAQLDAVTDQIRRSHVINPLTGTVLVTYAEPTEMTAAGKPLYKIARLDTLELRAYVSGAQLPHFRIGEAVTVLIDEDETTNRSLEGTVTWIASEAEFTPKLIQTKEERVSLVYAFKVRVANPDGRLKIGMPGEVIFNESGD